MSSYIISKNSEKTGTAYLVDRSIHRDKFWSGDIKDAKIFDNVDKANTACNKLKYGCPIVQEL